MVKWFLVCYHLKYQLTIQEAQDHVCFKNQSVIDEKDLLY